MLECTGLRKQYGEFVLGPIDLAVDREVLAVLGPSGGGKSTLLGSIAGVVQPDAGSVRLDDLTLDGLPPEDRGTALLFQDGALFPHMTARENVAYAATSADRVDTLAETLEIADVLDQPARTLSGGQRQRVGLARSLAADPDALLLDEPLANLDAPIKRRLRDEMAGLLSAADVPVIWVTHDQREATAVGDRVALLADGEIHQIGTPRTVFERPATPYVASFAGGANVLRATVTDGGGLRWQGYRLTAAIDGLASGRAVWVSVRAEHLQLSEDDAADQDVDGTVVPGTVRRQTFEGDKYLLEVRPEDTDATLEVALPPPADGTDPPDGPVTIRIPRAAVHVIGPTDDARRSDPRLDRNSPEILTD